MVKEFILMLSDMDLKCGRLDLIAFLIVKIDSEIDFWTTELYRFCDTLLSQNRLRPNGDERTLCASTRAGTNLSEQTLKDDGYDDITVFRAKKAGLTDQCLQRWRQDILGFYVDPAADAPDKVEPPTPETATENPTATDEPQKNILSTKKKPGRKPLSESDPKEHKKRMRDYNNANRSQIYSDVNRNRKKATEANMPSGKFNACPDCGKPMKVQTVRNYRTFRTRTYVCKDCGTRLSTSERFNRPITGPNKKEKTIYS